MADNLKADILQGRRRTLGDDSRPPPPYIQQAGPSSGPSSGPSLSSIAARAEARKRFASKEAGEGDTEEPYDPFLSDYGDPPEIELPWSTGISSSGKVDVYVDDLDTSPAPYEPPTPPEEDVDPVNFNDCPPLNIVIFLVGSRGDIQPYLALALQLIINHGHRVRIATHPAFAKLVADASVHLAGLTSASGTPLTGLLEFFSIGGDPHQLMAYMVRNPGLVPGLSAVWNGDIKQKRAMVKTMLMGCYRACFVPNESTKQPFGADAIISNPPAFAHVHVAEALGIPLVMSFTMPWTPTTAFPHPLVTAKTNRSEESVNHYSSYVVADALMWQGLGDIINTFRFGILGLQPLKLTAGPRVLERLKIPVTYAWSENLLPKPHDWKSNIDVVGFYSMPTKKVAKPDLALLEFLAMGEPPVYIGFGSIVVKDPDALTNTILAAVAKAKVRAIISAGWADLGGPDLKLPEDVFIVKGDIPHDWLFAEGRVAAVCHHGGAGTTSAGLRCGVPTIVVPFFGDQWFWGKAVAHAGAGPAPIPHADLTAENLAEAIQFCFSKGTREAAQELGYKIRSEQSTTAGIASFHRHLPLLNMRCQVDDTRSAIWWNDRQALRVSGAVAAVLVEEKLLNWRDFVPHRPMEYEATRHHTDPFTALGQSIVNVGGQAVSGAGQLLYAPTRGFSNLLLGVPKAVSAFQEGLENIPGIMGSPVRKRGKVDSFRSGMAEGVKGLGYGLYDGITGVVTEPYQGFRQNGIGGFISGAIRGSLNLAARPAGATLGLIIHPVAGMSRGARSRMAREGFIENTSVLCDAREWQSHEAAKSLSPTERRHIIETWTRLSTHSLVQERMKLEEKRKSAIEHELLAEPTKAELWPFSREMVDRMNGRAQRRRGVYLTAPDKGKGKDKDGRRSSNFSLHLRKSIDSRRSSKDEAKRSKESLSKAEETRHTPAKSSPLASPNPHAPVSTISSETLLSPTGTYTGPAPAPAFIVNSGTPPTDSPVAMSLSAFPSPPLDNRFATIRAAHSASGSTAASTVDLAMAGTERWASRSSLDSASRSSFDGGMSNSLAMSMAGTGATTTATATPTTAGETETETTASKTQTPSSSSSRSTPTPASEPESAPAQTLVPPSAGELERSGSKQMMKRLWKGKGKAK